MSGRFCKGKYGGPHDLDVVGQYVNGECRVCKREYRREYRQRPEYKAYKREYRQRPEVRAYRREYGQRPEVSTRHNTLQSLRRIRERRSRYEQQIKELLQQLGSSNGRTA